MENNYCIQAPIKYKNDRFRVPFFALRATQGKQGSAPPPAKKTAGQIEKETNRFFLGK
jgi:hypothetical protein